MQYVYFCKLNDLILNIFDNMANFLIFRKKLHSIAYLEVSFQYQMNRWKLFKSKDFGKWALDSISELVKYKNSLSV